MAQPKQVEVEPFLSVARSETVGCADDWDREIRIHELPGQEHRIVCEISHSLCR